MRDAVHSSAILLVRRAVVLPALGATVLFTVLTIVLTFVAASRPGGTRFGGPPVTLFDLQTPAAVGALVARPVMVMGVVVFGVAAAHLASQYASGWVRQAFTRDPGRLRWLWGSWISLSIGAVLLTVVAAISAMVTASICAVLFAVPTSAWTTADGVRSGLVALLGMTGGMIAFTVAGAALAIVLRSAIRALVVGLVYTLLEAALLAIGPLGDGLFPASAFAALAGAGGGAGLPIASVIASVVYLLVIVIGVGALVQARDVFE